jgi:hypothetical protein
LVLSEGFMAVGGLIIDGKVSCICSPTEVGLCGEYFFGLIKRNFVDKIELFVQLD